MNIKLEKLKAYCQLHLAVLCIYFILLSGIEACEMYCLWG
jgi:hypothetical protein